MKKNILIIVFSLVTINITLAQKESADRNDIPARFENYYNAAHFDSIYYMFSDHAKPNFPQDKTKAFLSQLRNSYGNMQRMIFLEYQSGFTVYKTVFDRGILLLHLSFDKGDAITALYARPFKTDSSVSLKRNVTPMHLPFKGEWTVFWGGDTKALNYHVVAAFQKNAFDIVINGRDGKSFRTDGRTNEDYYAFGQELSAPCDAEVVLAINGIKDNIPGRVNPLYAPGNAILLKTKNDEYILLAHLKQNTIKVIQGEIIKQGQLLALCGNSGNSSEPHLHFHLQDMEHLNQAVGIKCYFNKLEVDGMVKTDYSPIKGNRIKENEK